MTFDSKKMELTKRRLAAFWNQEKTDRACIAVVAPKNPDIEISMFRNSEDGTIKNQRIRNWTDPEIIYQNNLRRVENTYWGGDAFPVLFLNFGTSGHCNYYGSKPIYEKDTIWFNPAWSSLNQAETTPFNQALLNQHLELARTLAQQSKGQFYISMPDHCGTLDAIAHLYGTNNLLLDIIDQPNQIKAASKKVNQGWKQANQAFYDLLQPYNQGAIHAWMYLWGPGKLQHMQADISVMLSPKTYKELILPELEEQAEWLDYPVYHFDGIEQAQHLDMILSIKKLKAIQWTHVAGQPPALQYLPILQKIQKAGKSLIIMTPPEDIPGLLNNLSHNGLYLNTETQTPEQAAQLVALVEQQA